MAIKTLCSALRGEQGFERGDDSKTTLSYKESRSLCGGCASESRVCTVRSIRFSASASEFGMKANRNLGGPRI